LEGPQFKTGSATIFGPSAIYTTIDYCCATGPILGHVIVRTFDYKSFEVKDMDLTSELEKNNIRPWGLVARALVVDGDEKNLAVLLRTERDLEKRNYLVLVDIQTGRISKVNPSLMTVLFIIVMMKASGSLILLLVKRTSLCIHRFLLPLPPLLIINILLWKELFVGGAVYFLQIQGRCLTHMMARLPLKIVCYITT
jgi:hypothetical protein